MECKKEQLCPNCITGKVALELDPKELFCPYVYLYKNGECVKFRTIAGGEGK